MVPRHSANEHEWCRVAFIPEYRGILPSARPAPHRCHQCSVSVCSGSPSLIGAISAPSQSVQAHQVSSVPAGARMVREAILTSSGWRQFERADSSQLCGENVPSAPHRASSMSTSLPLNVVSPIWDTRAESCQYPHKFECHGRPFHYCLTERCGENFACAPLSRRISTRLMRRAQGKVWGVGYQVWGLGKQAPAHQECAVVPRRARM